MLSKIEIPGTKALHSILRIFTKSQNYLGWEWNSIHKSNKFTKIGISNVTLENFLNFKVFKLLFEHFVFWTCFYWNRKLVQVYQFVAQFLFSCPPEPINRVLATFSINFLEFSWNIYLLTLSFSAVWNNRFVR